MIFDRSREPGGKNENRKDVLFIDASREFTAGKNQNTLSDENISKIVDTYKKRSEIDKYSHVATFDEIKENDFNLNIPRYVDTFEEEAPVDIPATRKRIAELTAELSKTTAEMEKYLKELGL